jgi:hypothetical protein
MVEVARSKSEWHSRMTPENQGQKGYAVYLTKYPIGHKAYIYKTPNQAKTIARSRLNT